MPRQPRWRSRHRAELKANGIAFPKVQFAWVVSVRNTTIIPSWLKERTLAGLDSIPGQFWLKPHDAMALMTFCRSISVWYDVTKTEFKRCVRCWRPNVGSEAAALRKVMEQVKDRTTVICGKNCERDRESGLWFLKMRKAVAA